MHTPQAGEDAASILRGLYKGSRAPGSPANASIVLCILHKLSYSAFLCFSAHTHSVMVVLAKGELDQIALPAAHPPPADVRSVDLSSPDRAAAARALVAACEDHGFFRVTGHGVPLALARAAEAAAAAFFALPQAEKEAARQLGYGSKSIGGNGDLGWIEYLLLGVAPSGAVVPASSSTLPCAAAAAGAVFAASPTPSPLR